MQNHQYSPLQIPWKMQALLFRLVLHCCVKLCILQWSWFLNPIVFQIVNDNIVCAYYAVSLNDGCQQKQPRIWYVSFFSVYLCFCVQNADKTWTQTHQLVSLLLWGDTRWHTVMYSLAPTTTTKSKFNLVVTWTWKSNPVPQKRVPIHRTKFFVQNRSPLGYKTWATHTHTHTHSQTHIVIGHI